MDTFDLSPGVSSSSITSKMRLLLAFSNSTSLIACSREMMLRCNQADDRRCAHNLVTSLVSLTMTSSASLKAFIGCEHFSSSKYSMPSSQLSVTLKRRDDVMRQNVEQCYCTAVAHSKSYARPRPRTFRHIGPSNCLRYCRKTDSAGRSGCLLSGRSIDLNILRYSV